MKLLILSCSTGGGHNSAAAAIREYFEAQGHDCETVNALGFLPKAAAELISRGHELAYKYTPKLYGAGYRMGEKRPQQSFLYEQNSKGAAELLKTLEEGGYDAVICVHIFAGMMMTELRASGSTSIPSFFVATDYTCSPGAGSIDADAYFIPHPYLADEFCAQGIARELIVPSGIPVKAEFYEKRDKALCRAELGLPTGGRVVLVCCGSMGCGPIRSMALRLADELNKDDRLVIVCGSNKQLYRDLELITSEDERIVLYGFTDNMCTLMDAADILVTKAGGLSTTEAVAKRLPIIYIDAVPGCESRNIEFMTGLGYAVQAGNAAQISAICAACLTGALDPAAMVQRREPDFPTEAAKTIFDTVSEAVRRRENEKARGLVSVPLEVPVKLDKRMLLIVNPVAGKRAMAKNLAEAIGIFMSGGYLVTVMTTAASGNAAHFACDYAADYDMICCSGGDGTLKEVVSGLVAAGVDVPVGYMPSGSTNDFAEFHGISTDVLTAARNIVKGRQKNVDVGLLDGNCFINVADFGAFTWLPYTTPQRLKNTLGFYAYVLDAVKDITKLQSEHLKLLINGETVEGDFLFGAVASSSSLAGTLELFGEPVRSDDGRFEVVLIRRPRSPVELENTISALRSSSLNSSLIYFARTDSIEIDCDSQLNWAADGEKCVCRSQHRISMLPGRLRLVY